MAHVSASGSRIEKILMDDQSSRGLMTVGIAVVSAVAAAVATAILGRVLQRRQCSEILRPAASALAQVRRELSKALADIDGSPSLPHYFSTRFEVVPGECLSTLRRISQQSAPFGQHCCNRWTQLVSCLGSLVARHSDMRDQLVLPGSADRLSAREGEYRAELRRALTHVAATARASLKHAPRDTRAQLSYLSQGANDGAA